MRKWLACLLTLALKAPLLAANAGAALPVAVPPVAALNPAVAAQRMWPATPAPVTAGESMAPPGRSEARPASPVARPASPVAQPIPPARNPLMGLQTWLRQYLVRQDGTYGVYVRDLTTGAEVGVNADRRFFAASTFKVPVALYVMDQVRRKSASLDEVLTYDETDWEDGAGVLQASEPGDAYTVGELLELAMIHSDNIATNMLLRRFGRPSVWTFMQRLGVKNYYDGENNLATPRQLAGYMRYLLQSPAASTYRDQLVELLANTSFNAEGIAPGVPSGIKVAHKVGALPGVANDVAIVFAPGHTLLISVMSDDADLDAAFLEVMPAIAREVYARTVPPA